MGKKRKEVRLLNIEKLSDTKLEVLITKEDMVKWDVDVDCLTKNSPQSHTLFSDIIAQAQEQYDFSCSGANVVIETQICKDGGLRLFFNAVPGIEAELPALEEHLPKPQKTVILKIQSVEDVLAATRQLQKHYKGISSLFKYRENYYLSLQSQSVNVAKLYDLGEIMDDSDLFFGFLNEYGDNLVRDDFFSKAKKSIATELTANKRLVSKARQKPILQSTQIIKGA